MRYVSGWLVLLMVVGFSPLVRAESNTQTAEALILQGIQELDQAYNAWDPQQFQQAADRFQQAIDQDPENHMGHYWKGAALFNLASYRLYARERDKDAERGEATVDEGIKVLTRAIELNDSFSESFALRGVMRGMKIKLNMWSMFSQGPGVQSDRDQALKLNPDNPRVHYLTGISLWMSPEIFGGGAKQGLEHFTKAEELFEAEARQTRSPLEPAWGHSTNLSFIGDVYTKQGEWKKAYRYYQKTLMVNPNDQRAQLGLENISQQGEKE